MESRAVAILLTLGTLAAQTAPRAADPPARSGAWKVVTCATFGLTDVPANVECGFVTVPQRHANPAGPTLELATVIVRAAAEGRSPDPVFVAQGGPGGSSIAAFARAIIDDPDLRLSPNRDHVVWDQRGTLCSKPALLCPEATRAGLEAALETAPPESDPSLEMSAYRACGERLDREPVVLTTSDPEDEDGETFRVKLTGEMLGDLLYGALYSPDAHPVVPLAVDRATKGDFSLVESLLLPGAFFDRESAEGMYMTAVCADHGDSDPDAIDYAGITPRLARRSRDAARETLALCRDWKIELLPRDVLDPVRSDVPTLLLSGAYDPITPPSFATSVGDTLARNSQIVFPGGTHGQAFGDACATGIIRSFLDRPDTTPDAACAREPVAPYLVPTDLFVLPALRGFVTDPDSVHFSRRFLLLLGALLSLATALVAYPAGWALRLMRGDAPPTGGTMTAVSRWAPWLAVATLVALGAFLWALRGALVRASETTAALLYLGAILKSDRWVFALASVAAVLACAVVIAAIGLWVGRRRSFNGRLYYTFLALAAAAAAWSLWQLGLLWPTGLG